MNNDKTEQLMRIDGYTWGIINPDQAQDVQALNDAYNIACKSYAVELYARHAAAFMRGVEDSYCRDVPTFTVADVAEKLRVSDSYVRRLIRAGVIKSVGDPYDRRVAGSEIERYMNEQPRVKQDKRRAEFRNRK